MADGTRLKNVEDLAKRNEIRINELIGQFKTLEERVTNQITAQAAFEQRMEARFEQLLKVRTEGVEKGKIPVMVGSRSSNRRNDNITAMVEAKDWSQLPHDLLGSISNRLGAIEDFVAFSSVCTSWRSALREQNWSKRCVPWLLIRKLDSSSLQFHDYFLIPTLNKKKNRCNVKQSLINKSNRCWGSSIGWVFTLSHDNTTQLINPLTGVQIALPRLFTFIERALVFVNNTDKTNNDNNIFVMVIYGYQDRLAFAWPGYGEWTTLRDHENGDFADVACYRDRILGIRANGALAMCETDNESRARVSNFAPPPEFVNFDNLGRIYLIESAGDLLMVLIRTNFSEETRAFEVYKFNIDSRRWGELDDLGDRALFLGDNYSISVSQANGVDCIGNCIYTSSESGLIIFYMKDKRPVVYNFPYFSEELAVSTSYLASLLNRFRRGPVWVMPSLS